METHNAVTQPETSTAHARRQSDADELLAAARRSVRRMRLVGAHPALDFVNTQSGPSHADPADDTLRSYSELLAWAEYARILNDVEVDRLSTIGVADAPSSDEVLARAIELRTALHALFEAIADGRPHPAAALEAVTAAERDALARGVLTRRGSAFEWTWPDADDLGRPLWIVVHGAVELLRTGPLDRLKECGSCRFLFLDESKNRSRRWCSMSDCGTASKMRAYVRRRAERRANQRPSRDERGGPESPA